MTSMFYDLYLKSYNTCSVSYTHLDVYKRQVLYARGNMYCVL